jgi:UDP-N-acetylglucosamine diphosphorylase/glucosamine-1-phosphate N-acetyltransferase
MDAIIMVAGKSTRMHPLTLTRPKPLLPVANTTILEHNLEQLEGLVDNAILVLGFKGALIREAVERIKSCFGFTISYVTQEQQLGTGHALKTAAPHMKDRFLVFGGDDLFHRNDIQRCMEHEHALLVQNVSDPARFGAVVEERGLLKNINEKPCTKKNTLVNTGLMLLDASIFDCAVKQSERGEYELTDMAVAFSKTNEVHCISVQEYWVPIGYPWDLLTANKVVLSRRPARIMGTVEEGALMKGAVSVGSGTLIQSGARIEGPVTIGTDCTIGPHCHITGPTSIGNNCVIEHGSNITNSIIMNHATLSHSTSIHDSIIGERATLGAGTVAANTRDDKRHVHTMIKGTLVSTERLAFGCVIGDAAQLAERTALSPGVKIYPEKTTEPGAIVKEDVV